MKITDYCFVYFNGRAEKLKGKDIRPRDFFYGYHYATSIGYITEILEFGNKEPGNKILSKILLIIQQLILKAFKFQYDFVGIIKPNNWKLLKNSKNIILSNQRIAHSLLPFLLYVKLFKKSNTITVIAMGLFNSSSKNLLIIKIHNFLHKIMLKNISRMVFIGQPEYLYATQVFTRYSKKFQYIPFGVDKDFWKKKNTQDPSSDDYILFIGNDTNRDFDFLVSLANKLQNKKFIVVTEKLEESEFKGTNVKLLNGSWNKDLLTDEYLRNLYDNAKITIVPLKEGLQPSGQSVTLQSMATETPVIVTKTIGFWSQDDFIHKENIYFTHSNDLEVWENAIDSLYEDKDMYQSISSNSRNLIEKKYNSDYFNSLLIGK
jgi:glycosyltransferase involved in cell wall biosynthesis